MRKMFTFRTRNEMEKNTRRFFGKMNCMRKMFTFRTRNEMEKNTGRFFGKMNCMRKMFKRSRTKDEMEKLASAVQ